MNTGKTSGLAKLLWTELLTARATRAMTAADSDGAHPSLLSVARTGDGGSNADKSALSQSRAPLRGDLRNREMDASITVRLSASALAASRSLTRDTAVRPPEPPRPGGAAEVPPPLRDGVSAFYIGADLDPTPAATAPVATGRSIPASDMQSVATPASTAGQTLAPTDAQFAQFSALAALSAGGASHADAIKTASREARAPAAELVTPFLVRQGASAAQAPYLTRLLAAAVVLGALILLVL